MSMDTIPSMFVQLRADETIADTDLAHTQDGFWMVFKPLSGILATKGILDFPDANGIRLACDKFFDDWFLYAVPRGRDYVYSLLKLREQEHDAEGGSPADGDTPGVTISFVPFSGDVLLACLAEPTDENMQRVDNEIDRVVARGGQRHHASLKEYFVNPRARGPYLVADLYVTYIASLAVQAELDVPERYRDIARSRHARLRRFTESVNQAAGRVVCDHEKIYFRNPENLTGHEYDVILATHTGNTSRYSFAAEVEYHARFLTPFSKIRIPFLKKTVYDSAVRADMTIGDGERRKFAPYHRTHSRIVKNQYRLHKKI